MDPEIVRAILEYTLEGKRADPNEFTIATHPYEKNGANLVAIELRSRHGWYRFDTIPSQGVSANGSLTINLPWRGLGIGGALAQTREEACRAHGIEQIIIGENHNNTFWKRRGYTTVRRPEPYRALAKKNIIRYRENTQGFSPPLILEPHSL